MAAEDFGVKAKAKDAPVWLYVAIGTVLFAALVAFASYKAHQSRDLAQAAAWDIKGEPCPEVTREAFAAQPIKLKQQFDYDGLVISRAVGHADCDEVSLGGWKTFIKYPSCQLTGPGVLTVKANGQEHFYLPGVGRRTTISLREGKLICVLDGNFGKPSEG